MVKHPTLILGTTTLLLLTAACGSSNPEMDATPTLDVTATPTAPVIPYWEPAACDFPLDDSSNVECGYLVVPENRGVPAGSPIKVHVAIFKSTNPTPKPDPVIYVAGGGGTDQLGSAAYYLQKVGNAILQERDFIMFNQRGAYRNEPSLVCPDLTISLFSWASQPLSAHERADLRIEKMLSCYDDLLSQGIDLSGYNTVETAADINDLWRVLGYEGVNLYGTSSGTRTILTVMRNHPEGVRSVILDSVFPPQVNLYSTVSQNYARVFSLMFADCAAQSRCSTQYPDLEGTFLQLVDELNANPVNLELSSGTVLMDGGVFMEALGLSFYSTADIPLAPMRIQQAANGNFSGLAPWLESMFTDTGNFMAMGFEWSMMCNEEVPFESFALGRELAAELPVQIADYFDSYYEFTLCESWQSGIADPVENTAVVSDIPALIFSGGYDPVTPPEWSRMAAETLSNHFYYEFPGLSHGIMRSNACGLAVGLQFLDDPATEPDSSCVPEVPVITYK